MRSVPKCVLTNWWPSNLSGGDCKTKSKTLYKSKKKGYLPTSTASCSVGLTSGLSWLWRTSGEWRMKPRRSWKRCVTKAKWEERALPMTSDRTDAGAGPWPCVWVHDSVYNSTHTHTGGVVTVSPGAIPVLAKIPRKLLSLCIPQANKKSTE